VGHHRQPLFLPFLSTAVLMTVFSTAPPASATSGAGSWSRVAIAGAVVQALAGLIVSRNPIFDLHATDIVLLAVLEALLIAGAGAATELGERIRPDAWIRTAWCLTALMTMLALFPRLMLLLH
jgi:hypothetical protein